MVIKIFVLAVDDRIVDRNRVDQHGISIFHGRRRHHDESRVVRVERLHRLAVKRAAAFCSTGWKTHRDRNRNVRAPVMGAGLIENLIQRDAREIGKLHFDNRPHSLQRRSDRSANNCIFADRSVQHAIRKLLSQTLGRFERAAKCAADVLPIDEHAIVFAQQFRLCFADRFEIGDAHSG